MLWVYLCHPTPWYYPLNGRNNHSVHPTKSLQAAGDRMAGHVVLVNIISGAQPCRSLYGCRWNYPLNGGVIHDMAVLCNRKEEGSTFRYYACMREVNLNEYK